MPGRQRLADSAGIGRGLPGVPVNDAPVIDAGRILAELHLRDALGSGLCSLHDGTRLLVPAQADVRLAVVKAVLRPRAHRFLRSGCRVASCLTCARRSGEPAPGEWAAAFYPCQSRPLLPGVCLALERGAGWWFSA